MEVILLERIERLGQMGDVVRVKPGFARNYLLPQKKALRATDTNRKLYEQQRTQLEAVNLERRGEAEGIAKRMGELTVIIVRQASENDQLYGSVTVRDISQAVSATGFTVESKQVQLSRPIKTVGLHPVTVRLHPEVGVSVSVNVARSEDEAAMQAAGRHPSAVRASEDEGSDEAGDAGADEAEAKDAAAATEPAEEAAAG